MSEGRREGGEVNECMSECGSEREGVSVGAREGGSVGASEGGREGE